MKIGRRDGEEVKAGGRFPGGFLPGFRSHLWPCTHMHAPTGRPKAEVAEKKNLKNTFCKWKDCFGPLDRHVVDCLTPTELLVLYQRVEFIAQDLRKNLYLQHVTFVLYVLSVLAFQACRKVL